MSSKPFFAKLYALFTTMRFAVSLLVALALACTIGTVLKQNATYADYQREFGPFWFPIFEYLGLYDIYHSSWFLLILAFLVASTGLCVYRHTPAFIREIRSFRSGATLTSLRQMRHCTQFQVTGDFAAKIEPYLKQSGYRFRRTQQADNMTLWAAKRGYGQKFGYFFTHIGLIVIFIGGLIDSNIILKLHMLFNIKKPESQFLSAANMPERSCLPVQNAAFRAYVSIPEKQAVDFAWINSGKGVFLQKLPFFLQLKSFQIAHYSTGQPKHFISQVLIQDKKTGHQVESTITVNKPLIIDGIAIYQSSFSDGGSDLTLRAWNVNSTGESLQDIHATSLSQTPLIVNNQRYQLEWGELRMFNIENMGAQIEQSIPDTMRTFQERIWAMRNVKSTAQMRNLGPSIQFKLRDAQGQSSEYINYMQPFVDQNQSYFLSGVRHARDKKMYYMRLPLDQAQSLTLFLRLRKTFLNPQNIQHIAKRTADKAITEQGLSQDYYQAFHNLTRGLLTQFQKGGFIALEEFMKDRVPEDKRISVAQTYIRVLQSAAHAALQLSSASLAASDNTVQTSHFLLDSLVAISNLLEYGSPIYLQLIDVKPVQSSGFQITRSPGKIYVYMGCILLILGTLIMFYIHHTRLWIGLQKGEAILAMSSNRKNSTLDQLFIAHEQALRALTQTRIAE